MSYGPDPFEAAQREALRASDALLDRIGSRAPTPEDLDDPLVAALALMAAEIDLDAVPVELTRAAVETELIELGLPGPGSRNSFGSPVDERTGLVLDLRDMPRSRAEAAATETLRRRLPRVAAPTAIAPPRSLPRFGSGPEASRPEAGASSRFNLAAAFVAVVAALGLGLGVSAAVTGGRSVNPLTGIQQVVAQLTGGRTAEQSAAYRAAMRKLDAAAAALKQGDPTAARQNLRAVNLKDPALAADDVRVLAKRKAALETQLDR